MLQSLHKARPSTTLYYKVCTNYFLVLLCTTKLAHSTSQHYFVLQRQSLHKARRSTTKLTKLAQSTSQYYFVLQSLHKVFPPSITVYYKACTKHFQYYFILQRLHKVLTSTTTLYYKACTTKLAQSIYYFPDLSSTTWYFKAAFTLGPNYYKVHATFKQPAQCVLQHHVHIHAAITMRFAPARCRTQWRNRLRVDTFIAGCSHFTREKRNVSCSGFLHNTSPMQHSCSRYTAFFSNTCTFMRPLRCDLHPHVAEHHGRTDYASKRPATASHRSCPSSPAAATLHGKTQGLVLRLPPESNPMQHPCIITIRFAASRGKPACIYAHGNRAWKHHAAITLRSAPTPLSHHFLSHNPSSPPFVIP